MSCPNGTMWKPSCKRRSCPFCGPRWARDWQRVLGVNLEAVGVPVATLAITGPGADVLPWDCKRRHVHSGARGCKVNAYDLKIWSESLTYRWQKLRHAARIATKRELGYAPPWLLARVWEPQKRGVPHVHLVMPFGTGAEQQAAWAFTRHLKRLSREYGFGDVGRHKGPDLQPLQGREAARYLANYLTGRTAKKGTIRDNIADPHLPRSLLWLTPKLTRETMVTMRTLRRARHVWAAWDGICPVPRWSGGLEEAVRIAVVFRTVYPKRAGPPANVDEALTWARRIDRADTSWPDLVKYEDGQWVRDETHDRELTRLAFVATHDRDWRRDEHEQVAA